MKNIFRNNYGKNKENFKRKIFKIQRVYEKIASMLDLAATERVGKKNNTSCTCSLWKSSASSAEWNWIMSRKSGKATKPSLSQHVFTMYVYMTDTCTYTQHVDVKLLLPKSVLQWCPSPVRLAFQFATFVFLTERSHSCAHVRHVWLHFLQKYTCCKYNNVKHLQSFHIIL